MVNEMGIETIAIIGLSLFQAKASMDAAEDQAQAGIDQANIQSENKAKEVRIKAARQRSSFLNSGLTLEGTPLSAINSTFNSGIADINQITSNANKSSKNLISNARTEAITSLATTAIGTGFGSGNPFASGNSGSANGGFNAITSNPSFGMGEYGKGFSNYSDGTRIDWMN